MQHIGSMNLQGPDLIKEKKIKGYLLFHYLESMQDRPPTELLVTGSGSALSSTQGMSQRSVQPGPSEPGNQKETAQTAVFVLNILWLQSHVLSLNFIFA